jgi:hypothetical protein
MPSFKTHNSLKLLNSQKNILKEFNPRHISCPILSKSSIEGGKNRKKPKKGISGKRQVDSSTNKSLLTTASKN